MNAVKVPYANKKELAEMLDISKATIQQRIGEMEASGRYDSYTVIRDGQILLVNILSFLDWMKYRRYLQDKNLKKYVPEYNPQKVAESMGWKIDRVNLRKVAI